MHTVCMDVNCGMLDLLIDHCQLRRSAPSAASSGACRRDTDSLASARAYCHSSRCARSASRVLPRSHVDHSGDHRGTGNT